MKKNRGGLANKCFLSVTPWEVDSTNSEDSSKDCYSNKPF